MQEFVHITNMDKYQSRKYAIVYPISGQFSPFLSKQLLKNFPGFMFDQS